MKSTLLIILFVNIFFIGFAREARIKLYVTDNTGRKDSIVFGTTDNSTLGIDAGLGEKDIFGSAYDNLDMRIIQRDSQHFNCIRETHFASPPSDNLYFPHNIDTKIDFRPFGGFSSVNNNFEIYIHAVDFPITITAEYEGITGHASDVMASFALLDSDCNASKIVYADPRTDLIAVISDNSFTTLVAAFDHEVSAREIEMDKDWNIFPSPSSSTIKISSVQHLNGSIEILNLNGQKLNSYSIDHANELMINIEDLPRGLYMISFMEAKTGNRTTRKFIKK